MPLSSQNNAVLIFYLFVSYKISKVNKKKFFEIDIQILHSSVLWKKDNLGLLITFLVLFLVCVGYVILNVVVFFSIGEAENSFLLFNLTYSYMPLSTFISVCKDVYSYKIDLFSYFNCIYLIYILQIWSCIYLYKQNILLSPCENKAI